MNTRKWSLLIALGLAVGIVLNDLLTGLMVGILLVIIVFSWNRLREIDLDKESELDIQEE